MRIFATTTAALGALLAATGCATTTTSSARCDRDCLIDVADAYVAALAAHEPTAAPLADDVTFVENIEVKAVGDAAGHHVAEEPGEARLGPGHETLADLVRRLLRRLLVDAGWRAGDVTISGYP